MIYCDAPVAEAMHRAVLQQRLAESEEQIASGLRHIARQREVITELESKVAPATMPNICLRGLNCCKLLDGQPGLAVETTKQKYKLKSVASPSVCGPAILRACEIQPAIRSP